MYLTLWQTPAPLCACTYVLHASVTFSPSYLALLLSSEKANKDRGDRRDTQPFTRHSTVTLAECSQASPPGLPALPKVAPTREGCGKAACVWLGPRVKVRSPPSPLQHPPPARRYTAKPDAGCYSACFRFHSTLSFLLSALSWSDLPLRNLKDLQLRKGLQRGVPYTSARR